MVSFEAQFRECRPLTQPECVRLGLGAKPQTAQFAVIQFQGGWRILAEGRQLPRLYKYSIDAEEAALRLASRARESGQVPEVIVQQPHGELRRLSI